MNQNQIWFNVITRIHKKLDTNQL